MAKQPSQARAVRNRPSASNLPTPEQALLILQMIQQASFPSVSNKLDAANLQAKMERVAKPLLDKAQDGPPPPGP